MTPLVSVIIPNYNHARYLDLRLQTILNQTYQNFEVIILDDKSTDNSLEVINKYKDNLHVSQIVVNEQNTGSPFRQWDKGINLAKGELIWIAESDDYNELTFLEELITEWQKYTNVVVIYSSYVKFKDNEYVYLKERKNQCFDGKTFVKKRLSRGCVICNASGVVFQKKAYHRINKDYMNFRNAGDYMFWVSMLQYGSVLKINKNLTYFRQSSVSVTGKCEKEGITAYEDRKILDYIEKNFKLSRWQKAMAYASKLRHFQYIQFNSDDIRSEVYSLWDAPNHVWRPSSILLWLIGALERHIGILI